MMFAIGRRSEREFNAEGAAVTGRTGSLDAAMVRGANGFSDGKAEARTAQLARARLIHAIESFENTRQGVRGNSDAVVGYLEQRLLIARAHSQIHRSSCGCVLDSVIEEVHDHLLHAGAIAFDPNVFGGVAIQLD